MKNEDINKQPISHDYQFFFTLVQDHEYVLRNSNDYYDIALKVVNHNGDGLKCVNEKWALKHPTLYKEVALVAVRKKPYALDYVNKDWISKNSDNYKEIVEAALGQNKYVLGYVNKDWISNNPDKYEKIALGAVNQSGYALEAVNENEEWVNNNPKQYYNIARVALEQNVFALEYVNRGWALDNSNDYYEIALVAVSKCGSALRYASNYLRNDPKMVQAALSQDGSALQYAGEVFRNNIKIVISSLIQVDGAYFLSDTISKILSMTPIKNDLLLYLYILNNKTVSNKFKHALFEFFKNKFDQSDNFNLYKNILEFYLTLDYTDAAPNYALLKHDDSKKQLHMFLSLANHSPMEDSEFDKLLENEPNNTIKNYLKQKDRHNLKSIKDFNIYSFLLPKNLFVVNGDNYDKIIKKMNKNGLIKNEALRLVLSYFTIKDLLKLSEGLRLGDKLEVKYLDIEPKFEGEDGEGSTGIKAFFDAIKNDGSLRNTGKYLYDSYSTIYNSLDIELSLYSALVEVIGH